MCMQDFLPEGYETCIGAAAEEAVFVQPQAQGCNSKLRGRAEPRQAGFRF
jgi:hypothetical protein